MTMPEQADHRARLQNAMVAIRKLQAKVAALEGGGAEPVAVIGVACRFPGQATGPDAYWRLLREGVDAVGEIPATRFAIDDYFDADADSPGKTYTRCGGFIEGVDRFDPHFFGISPREAVELDPQQRLLLELAWSALEAAGIAPGGLRDSRTGVYVGVTGSDYGQLLKARGVQHLSAYHASGSTSAFTAGRVSYVLGLSGPSVAIDTACSSSLSAAHLACQGLRAGECELAIAAGVNVMLTPDMFITTSKNRMLSPAGRCRTFDAAADGFVRGEGCGVIVLKRLSSAIEDGDRILAVIRGSAMNQDGASSGIMVPNRLAQEAAIRDALAAAGVQPHEVQYVEAHGTGTPLGDPIEMRALGAVLGEGRGEVDPFFVGSVKTNIGHLEAASGIAGLIKVILMLERGEIPPSLHFHEPSPHIPWEQIQAVVPTTCVPWPDGTSRRLAGVSSFGASGTNVHMVLEAAPARPPRDSAADRPLHVLALSARSGAELRAQAGNFRDHLVASPRDSVGDIGYTSAAGRTHFGHRLAVLGATHAQMAERLDAWLAGDEPPGIIAGLARPGVRRKVAFLFTGQGSQYVGMGRQLFETEPVFRAALERCDEILHPHLERPLLALLHPPPDLEADAASLLEQTAYTQPALFAIEYALAELWRSWGIEPYAVLGHSVGEYVAACVAGVFPLEVGLALIAERARLMQALPAGGKMVAVRADEALVAEAVGRDARRVSIAAINGPASVVISGASAAVAAIVTALRERGIDCKPLFVSHAFHSPLLEPVLEPLEAAAARVAMRAPELRLVSNLTGALAGAELTEPGYWRRHAREPVQFARGMRTLAELGCNAFIEIGPHPVLLGMGRDCLPAGGSTEDEATRAGAQDEGLWLPSLRREREDWAELLVSLARLHTAGATVDWRGFDRGRQRRSVWLPTYPFQGRRYWLETPALPQAPRPAAGTHPLLGMPIRTASRQRIFEARLSASAPAYLADHRVHGAVVLPAAAYIEMAAAAVSAVWDDDVGTLDDVVLHEPLVLPDGGSRTVQLVFTPQEAAAAAFEVFGLEDEDDAGADRWRLHASGTARRRETDARAPEPTAPAALVAAMSSAVSVATHYEQSAGRGLDFGETFRGVLRLWRGESASLGEVELPDTVAAEADAYTVHPVLLDACLQVVGAALSLPDSDTFLPLGCERVRFHERATGRLWSRATARPAAPGVETVTADVVVHDSDGRVLLEIDGIALRPARREAFTSARDEIDEWLYDVAWQPQPHAAIEAPFARRELAELLAPAAARAAALNGSADARLLTALQPRLDGLCAAFIERALDELGWQPRQGERVGTVELAARLGIAERYHRLLARLLEMLAEDGVLAAGETDWRVVRASDRAEPESLLAEVRSQFPENAAELAVLERCANALADVLRGGRDPLELLFPGGSLAETAQMYQSSPLTRELNALVAAAVAGLVHAFDPRRPVRILEIGAGTGGTTSHVLAALPATRTDYVFTDVSPGFVEKAKAKFGAYPFVRFGALDIARDPAAQGYSPRSFDLVVAANVLHATPDLRRTLRHVRELLAPGGMLVLLEGVAPERFADLTVGLTDGWWCFADGLRSYALIGEGQWHELLHEVGFDARAIRVPAPFAGQTVIVARAPAVSPPAPGTWLVLADAGPVARDLAGRLRARGEPCVLVRPTGRDAEGDDVLVVDPAHPASFRELLTSLTAGGRTLRGVVDLWALDDAGAVPPVADADAVTLDAAQRRVTGGVLHLTQGLAAMGAAVPVWLVTRGAQAVADEPVSPVHAPLWGLGRVIAIEHPELRCVRVDLDPAPHETDAEALLAELAATGGEDQIALRRDGRYVARLLRRRPAARALPLLGGQPFQLGSVGPRVLDSLRFEPLERRPPDAGEVEVEVIANGLAFRDVLNALGQYPGPEVPLGGEFAGIVTAAGEGVEGFVAGDAVLGSAPGAFRSFVNVRADLVARKPASLTMVEAAGVASSFLTAQYALHHLARITAGDRVLVHAAAGGVGQAAIQLARLAGAEIYATAGSPHKRAFLRSLGIRHVFDSRSVAFADEVRRATGGEGVDIVLNSLADEFVPRSLEALADGGRFVELGKRGIWEPARVAEVRPRAQYFVVDLAEKVMQEPGFAQRLMHEVLPRFDEGVLRPLPVKTFAMADAVAAFRYMAQARHVGRIVLVHDREPRIRADATYLITGGLGGVGLSVARWLVDEGARSLVLVGRRPPSDSARAVLELLERAGTRVTAVQADIARSDDVDRVMTVIRDSLPPLRGVFHGALVLDDSLLLQQSWQRFENVFAPRVTGGWLLHSRTATLPLDFFVMFSAAGSLLGSAAQGNYAAANAFLDALAYHRRDLGLPGLSVLWGVWSEVGRAAELGVAERAKERGIGSMTPRRAVAALASVMRQVHARADVAVMPVDWRTFLPAAGARGASPFFAELAAAVRAPRQAATGESAHEARRRLRRELDAAPPSKRRTLMAAHVRTQVAKVLSLDTSHSPDSTQPLQEMGLDSLMAVELRTLLAAGLELRGPLPATLAFDYPTIDAITGFLLKELFGASPGEANAELDGGRSDEAAALAGVDALSDAEAEALLEAELESIHTMRLVGEAKS
jgi:acyl transferase domain-containing protein/NADPH:quinone reductase-like Zn-dependent oxidoreductase/SAM-dependent methyltransferase